jgi:hypothetical protein
MQNWIHVHKSTSLSCWSQGCGKPSSRCITTPSTLFFYTNFGTNRGPFSLLLFFTPIGRLEQQKDRWLFKQEQISIHSARNHKIWYVAGFFSLEVNKSGLDVFGLPETKIHTFWWLLRRDQDFWMWENFGSDYFSLMLLSLFLGYAMREFRPATRHNKMNTNSKKQVEINRSNG